MFNDDFDGRDLTSKWYSTRWFNAGTTVAENISVSNSVLRLGGGNASRAEIVSAIAKDGDPYYEGEVFGNGAYFEARIRFDPSFPRPDGGIYPAFWSMAIEHIHGGKDGGAAVRWPGQAANYRHFAELDFMEAYTPAGEGQTYEGKTTYLAAVHDWYGTASPFEHRFVSNFPDVGEVDWNEWHKYGCVWVPQGDGDYGYIQHFFDDVPGARNYYKAPIGDPPLPDQDQSDALTPETATATFAILDEQHLALALSSDGTWPMEVDWVRVWQ